MASPVRVAVRGIIIIFTAELLLVNNFFYLMLIDLASTKTASLDLYLIPNPCQIYFEFSMHKDTWFGHWPCVKSALDLACPKTATMNLVRASKGYVTLAT